MIPTKKIKLKNSFSMCAISHRNGENENTGESESCSKEKEAMKWDFMSVCMWAGVLNYGISQQNGKKHSKNVLI